MAALKQSVLDWLRNVLQPEYEHVQRTFGDVTQVLQQHRTLRPKTDIYTYQDGRTHLLLILFGTISIGFLGQAYDIPLHIWIPQNYPSEPPMVFVAPSSDMGIRPSNHVGVDRRCYHPYLAYWSIDYAQSNLFGAIEKLREVFSREPPVYTLAKPSPLGAHAPTKSYRPEIPAKEGGMAPTNSSGPSSHANGRSGHVRTVSKSRALSPEQEKSWETKKDVSPPPVPERIRISDHGENNGQHRFQSPAPTNNHYQAEDKRARQILQVPQEDVRQKLLDAIEVKMRQKAQDNHTKFLQQVSVSDAVKQDLIAAQSELESQVSQFTQFVQHAEQNALTLKEKISQATAAIAKNEELGAPDVDACFVAQNVVFNQLYDLIASEAATEDSIYALGKALEHEKVSLDNFLKFAKILAREQFMQRALIIKIAKLTKLL